MNVITSFLVNKRTSLSWAENTLTWSLLLSPWETAPSRKPYQPSPVSQEIWVFPLLRYMKDKSRASFLHSFVRIAFLFVLLLSLTDAICVFRDVISVCRDFSNEVSPPTPNPASLPPNHCFPWTQLQCVIQCFCPCYGPRPQRKTSSFKNPSQELEIQLQLHCSLQNKPLYRDAIVIFLFFFSFKVKEQNITCINWIQSKLFNLHLPGHCRPLYRRLVNLHSFNKMFLYKKIESNAVKMY